MSKKIIKESADERCIREFINHVCNGELASANACLDEAIKEKVKNQIRRNLPKEK